MSMDLNVISSFAVSGKADDKGRDTWPSSYDDRELSRNLYSQAGANESTRLDIQFEVFKNKRYTYYHFLKLHNVAERPSPSNEKPIGRSKSFFGLSIRFEECYCRDVVGIYHLLEYIYNEFIEGTILKKIRYDSEDYLVYQIRDLSEAENIFRKAENSIKIELQQFKNDIEELPNSYKPNPSGQVMQFHLNETGSKTFFDSLFQNSEVYVSDEYLSLSEIAKQQKEEIERLAVTLQQKEESLQKQENTNRQNTENLKKKEKEVFSLKSSIEDNEKEIKRLKTAAENAEKQLNAIKTEIKSECDEDTIKEFIVSVSKNNQLLNDIKKHLHDLSEEQVRLWEDINKICTDSISSVSSNDTKEHKDNLNVLIPGAIQRDKVKKWFPIAVCIIMIALLSYALNPSPSTQNEVNRESTKGAMDSLKNVIVKEVIGLLKAEQSIKLSPPSKPEETVQEESGVVTWLDIDGEGISTRGEGNNRKTYIKSGTYSFKTQIGSSKRKPSVGCGNLTCDNKEITINSSNKTFTIPENLAASTTITFTYSYYLNGQNKNIKRQLIVEQ